MILDTIELLNTAKKLTDKRTAADERSSVFEENVSVIMSPSLDLNETIRVDPIREADKYMDVGIITRRKKKRAKKKKLPIKV